MCVCVESLFGSLEVSFDGFQEVSRWDKASLLCPLAAFMHPFNRPTSLSSNQSLAGDMRILCVVHLRALCGFAPLARFVRRATPNH